MRDRVGLAVVGLGMAAKPHALALQDLADQIDVRGCYARSAEARAAFCQTYGFPQAADIEALAHDPTVDALLLITPPNARRELISLFAGQQKHILTEKPLERTSGAAMEIVDLCAASDVSLGVVFVLHVQRLAEVALEDQPCTSGDIYGDRLDLAQEVVVHVYLHPRLTSVTGLQQP